MSIMHKSKQQIKKKVKKVVFKLIKPFIPFILIIFCLIMTYFTVVDAIFVEQVQTDTSLLSEVGQAIKNKCIEIAESLNLCNKYKDDEEVKEVADIDGRELDKQVQWSHLYAIMAFESIANNKEMNEDLLNSVASEFESKFKYEEMTITTETTTKDENGNEVIVTNEEKAYILVESDTIMGHYKYNYEEQTVQEANKKITKKVFKNEELIGEEYERLKNYLKDNLNVKDSDLNNNVQIVIQAANGYYEGEDNTNWSLVATSTINKNKNSSNSGMVEKGMFTWPVPGYTRITSQYGGRTHPIYGNYNFHSGTDVRSTCRNKFCGYGRWKSYKSCLSQFLWKLCNDRPPEMVL